MFFSVSGLRGIVGKDLTPDVIKQYLTGFYRAVKGNQIVVGRDPRRDSADLLNLVTDTLTSFGAQVVDLGIVPSPTVLLVVKKLGFDGGIIITASHNPYPYNGLKFVHRGGRYFFYHEIEEITKGGKPPSNTGKVSTIDGLNIHIEEILKLPLITNNCNLRVGVDAVNGAGCLALKGILNRLGCEVVAINDQPTGVFTRPPEPTADALKGLSKLIQDKNLDVGLALDPDADRLSIIDENANPLGEEYTLPIIANEFLNYKKGPVVVNLSTSRMIDDVVQLNEVKLYRTRVGEANVVEEMLKVSAAIGGEGNGGVIIPEINLTRDGILAAAAVVSIIKRNKKSISQIAQMLPEYIIRKERLALSLKYWRKLKKLIVKEFRGDKNTLDGIRVVQDRMWFHIRPSRTEPVIRLIIEAEDEEIIRETIQCISQLVRNLG